MEDVYLPYYKKTVQPVTYQTAYPQYKTFIEVFADKLKLCRTLGIHRE